MSVHVHWSEPQYEVFRNQDGRRYCFTCRKRRDFEWVRKAPIGDSWYGPHDQVECSVCKSVDGDLFPGYSREWT